MSNFVESIPVTRRTIHEILLWQEQKGAARTQESAEVVKRRKRRYSLMLREESR